VDYSDTDNHERAHEEQTWIHFSDFLDDCESMFTSTIGHTDFHVQGGYAMSMQDQG
jgi:hypothetical protein